MATASPTYSPPDTPADVGQMMESPVTSASPTYSDLEERPGDGLMEEAMGVVAEMLVTFHGVRQRDWIHRPWDIPVLPGLDIPWHPPFIPGYGSYMNSLGLDPEMAAELAHSRIWVGGVMSAGSGGTAQSIAATSTWSTVVSFRAWRAHRWRLGLAQTGGYLKC